MNKEFLRKNGIILGILFAVLAVSFYDVFFLNKTFKVSTANAQALHTGAYGQEDNKPSFIPVNGTDASVLEEPLYQFIKVNLKRGILPLWNPHQACGYPLIGMIQTGMFFPLHFILYIFPEYLSWDLLIISRFLLAGIFMFWLMRTFGFSKIPSMASAIIFMLSGPMVLLQYWTANVDILLPVLLISIELLIRKTKAKHIGFLSIVVALTFYAGHPEHIFLVNLYGVLFLLFRLYTLRYTVNWGKVLLYAAFAYVLGIALSAMVLFPFIRNWLTEFWHGHPPGVGLLNEESRERAITLLIPKFFQKESLTYQFVFAGYWGGYFGILPIGLALMSFMDNHKKGLNYFFGILGFLILSKAYGLFYINWIGYLPIFNQCRYAIHTPHIVAVTIAVLAGMGLRSILYNNNVFKKALLYSSILSAIILFHLFYYRTAFHFKQSLQTSLFAFFILILFQIILFIKENRDIKIKLVSFLLVGAITFELFSYIHRERPKRYESFGKVPYMEFLNSLPERARSYGMFWAFYPNTATGFQVDDFGIFFGMLPKRFVNFVHNLMNRNIFKNDLRPPALRASPITYGTPFMDMLNVKYLITPTTEMMTKILINFDEVNENRPAAAYEGEVNIYPRKDAFKRTYIVHRVVFQSEVEEAYKILRKMQLHLRDFVVLNHKANPLIWLALKDTPEHDASTSNIIKYTPNEVIIEADMQNAGLLVLSDTFHPDWKATINNRPSIIYQTNYLVRSVFLPPGKHTVRYVFKPQSFFVGAWISLASLIITLSLIFSIRIAGLIPQKTKGG